MDRILHGSPHCRTSLVEIGSPSGLLYNGTNRIQLLSVVMELDLLIAFSRNDTRQDILQLILELREVGAISASWRSGKCRLDTKPVTTVMPPLDLVQNRLLRWEFHDCFEGWFLHNKVTVS